MLVKTFQLKKERENILFDFESSYVKVQHLSNEYFAFFVTRAREIIFFPYDL